jgi:hypothetical protein
LAAGLLGAAHRLASAGRGRPAQPYLKRAVSTAYYALFEALARECADSLVGTGRARGTSTWGQVYRALEHGFAKNACSQAKNLSLPASIVASADTFTALQEQRHQADYDPTARFSRADVIDLINSAETAIRSLRSATRVERRDFAVLVLLRRR